MMYFFNGQQLESVITRDDEDSYVVMVGKDGITNIVVSEEEAGVWACVFVKNKIIRKINLKSPSTCEVIIKQKGGK